ncbi:MAG: murein biosynthesis integral membrane protein MurJ [Ectothiorhodospiraceae bacterium]|nr:murein biosynthesis integral membrane protein MurJ [Ectothiorhodospiraceae bacterium]
MSLLKSTAVFGVLTMLSRVLGLVRDVVIAAVFGSSAATDAFFVAFKIPNFMRRLFAEGAFSQAFVPVLSATRTTEDTGAVRHLVSRTIGTLLVVLLALTVLAVLGAEYLVMLFAPGFLGNPEQFGLTVDMVRITFPYLLFISLVAAAQGVLNTYGRFGPAAFAPVLLNLVLIASAWWWAPLFQQPVKALAAGVFVAGVLQVLYMLPFLYRLGMLSMPRWGWRDSGVRRILKLMLPAIFGSSVAQINLLVDTLLASFLIAGSISWLYYSDRLVEFPLGVFGVALGTVILPRLSGEHAARNPEHFSRTLDWALRWAVLIAIPAAVGLAVMAGPIMTTLFQYGAFGHGDARAASLSLVAYSLGLLGFMMVKVLSPGYFARQDMVTPVKIAAVSMACNMAMSVSVVLTLRDTLIGHAGLALATGLAATINAGLLFAGLRRSGVYRPQPGWGRLWLQVALATATMAAVLLLSVGGLEVWLAAGLAERVTALLGWLCLACLIYLGVLMLAGLRPRHLREAHRNTS